MGVYRADTPESLAGALENAFSYEDQVVVERCIIGREFSIGVIDGRLSLSSRSRRWNVFMIIKVNIRPEAP